VKTAELGKCCVTSHGVDLFARNTNPPGAPTDTLFVRGDAMRWIDAVGYLASVLVLLTFYMKDMVPLRISALFSNAAFIVYGGTLHLVPIVLLHSALVPINICRLIAALRASSRRNRIARDELRRYDTRPAALRPPISPVGPPDDGPRTART
jgi:hypothetical protein